MLAFDGKKLFHELVLENEHDKHKPADIQLV